MHVVDLPAWADAQHWLTLFGPWALGGALAIVFAECGLLLGFFLPGDSLLFTVGLMISAGHISQPLWLACVLLSVAAFVGNACGYEIGYRAGPAIFRRDDSRLFKRRYVEQTMDFFEEYGSRAILLARFVPVVRTFITVTAGVGRMDRRRYLLYSGIGGTLWASGVTILGSLLGRIAFVRTNIEAMLVLIVFISVIPMGLEYLRERGRKRRAGVPAANPAPTAGRASAYDPAAFDRAAAYDPAAYDPAAYDPAAYDPAAFDPRSAPPPSGGRHLG